MEKGDPPTFWLLPPPMTISHYFKMKMKIINFRGRVTAPPQTPPSRRLRRLDSRVFGARPATPNVPVALTPTPMPARSINLLGNKGP